MNNNGIALRIRGKVQGVGFRPWVWQLAQQLQLKGDVCNDGAGVLVRLTSPATTLLAALHQHCPPLARIDSIEQQTMCWISLPESFTIRHSDEGAMTTQIVPDAATCPACLRELHDPTDRRYRYPFINCTHCGPRYTIIHAIPYDRPATVMAAFPLCPACEREYRNPLDRRFHAQPLACTDCGPQIIWHHNGQRCKGDSALQQAVTLLKKGGIVAIKGLGGFHLAVDARNPLAVQRLRQRKQRPAKPFAVMIPDTLGLPDSATAFLTSPAAPIVLVDRHLLSGLSAGIAPGLNETGVMLAANPLQHLLMADFGGPLVMTSGNLNGLPPAIENDRALAELAGIADGWLLHNRPILQRMDDSVMRASGEMLRRSRGFVPDALPLPPGFNQLPPILALGGDLKNTFCLVRDDQAVLSQYFGDLAQSGVETQWRQALQLMCEIYHFTPQQIAVDAHPAWRSAQLGREMALPLSEILHHHAHAAACLAEHHWPLEGGKVLALALDGIGYGADGQLWGGECLRVDYRECTHLGGLPPVALPGGDLAARQPWRNLLAQCEAFVPHWQHYAETAVVRAQPWQPLARAITRGVNAPLASSCGRLFDAVAAALGCAPLQQSYEGEAACLLETMALDHGPCPHSVTLPLVQGCPDMATFWQQWLGWQASAPARAWAFHDALAQGLAELVRQHASHLGISTLVCCGGVMHNRLLRERLRWWLSDLEILFPTQLPAGDGALSLGQALIAAARLIPHTQGKNDVVACSS
ncbi:carbamoyltransferase HypF [Pantoea phytobeneficialis]|uniref:Carbamoyltransferase HypF n=1 Tax=Pantoea phytobeneficialis TaxID=2052056 RepID=A0AAP9KRQ0_9GAMM|nr:carbamoyltransferase HypF [Pantoea phytobeneficialis]MDO6406752.1 carbamoyltransferase HypF [Pantoea phytobeneficialis]QGR09280.1 carbamoyltransferase HypF [Pantoea phytobeneficialis]